jgi:hypothetical protein
VADRRWRFWAQGTLLSGLAGHWIANLLLDGDQYARAAVPFTWRAVAPAALQTILVLSLVVMPGSGRRPSGRRGRRAAGPLRALPLLAAAQLLLFLVLEVSERVVQREPFAGGLFGADFGFELVFAIASAFLLALAGSLALRAIGSARRRPMTQAIHEAVRCLPRTAAPAQAVVVVGGVRAPPAPVRQS